MNYGRERYGIPSPYEQSRRHARILGKLLERLEISTRTDKLPEFHNVVLMHPQAIIQRPDAKAFDTSFLIKADQFRAWHEKLVDGFSTGGLFKAIFNVRSPDTIREWGEKLKRQHRPQDLLDLPDFMQPKSQPAKAVMEPRPAAPVFAAAPATPEPTQADASLAKKLICAHCREKISFPEGKFCWNNAKRFGGLQYCREHQELFV